MTSTLGQDLRDSAKVHSLLDNLVEQVVTQSNRIDGVKGPAAGLEERARNEIQKLGAVRSRPLFYNYLGSGVGRGPYVELEDGSVKLDLINGIGIHIFGHSHPRIVRATLEGALSDVVHQGNLQPNGEYLHFSDKLLEIAKRNSRLNYVWLATCGTMANENALKMARQKKKGARMIMTFKNAFAGRSTMMTEITDNPAFKVNIPEYGEILRLPFHDPKGPADKTLSVMKEHVAKHENNICCFVFEPMLGEGGYRAASKEFYLPLMEFCRSKGIPVWADEIQTFTRTGNFFAFETHGIGEYIDICTIAKTAQNGATFFTEEFKPDPGLLGGTFSGSTPALRAGLEILNMLDHDGYMGPQGKVMKIHKEFIAMLNELNETTCKGQLREAGGLGLMVAVTPLDGTKDKQIALLKTLFKNGLICFGCGSDPYRIRFLIPAIVTSDDIQVAKRIIEKSIQEHV
ncbi:MAG TPA: aminotransferase class III-fold pyridoxal phosphate-dependent enzyme [Bdellovibrionales bacterium]|nr:aminotransferase class III-fold pyridoxal phosphate-dependent enzyme [Bdellovibrionales bacterium]